MTALGGIRLATVAVTLAAMQALLIDAARSGPFTHIDLPLAAVIVLVILRPEGALVTGFVFGLAVDLFGSRLFGVHCLAYCLLGSVAAIVPVGALRTKSEAIACLTAAQALVAITVTTSAVLVTTGALPPDTFGRYVQATAWTLLLVVPVVSASGTNIGLLTPEPAPLSGPPTSAEWA
jgi:rod shape-determining protein MreD